MLGLPCLLDLGSLVLKHSLEKTTIGRQVIRRGAPRSPTPNTPTCGRSPLQLSFLEGSDRHPIQIAGPASSAPGRYSANLYASATRTCVRAHSEPCQASTSPSQEKERLRGLEETPPLAADNTLTKETSC